MNPTDRGPRVLTLAEFATLSARIEVGGSREDVLEEAGISLSSWEATTTSWLARMAQDAQLGRFRLARLYAKLFEQYRREANLMRRCPRPPLEGTFPTAPHVEMSPAIALEHLGAPTAARAAAAEALKANVPQAPGMMREQRVDPRAGIEASRAPPSVAPSAHVARLTVDQLAAMRAELATSPDAEHPDVRKRFGLDDEGWAIEEAYWQRTLALDKELFARYLKRFQYCRSLLQRGG